MGASTSTPESPKMTLDYFPVMAKGLGPTLVAQFSGLDWEGPAYVDMQPTGVKLDYKKVSPFGQRPILIVDGITMSQTVAIISYIGRKAGMMGDTDKDFAMSQMLLAEAEDVYKAVYAAAIQPATLACASSADRVHVCTDAAGHSDPVQQGEDEGGLRQVLERGRAEAPWNDQRAGGLGRYLYHKRQEHRGVVSVVHIAPGTRTREFAPCPHPWDSTPSAAP